MRQFLALAAAALLIDGGASAAQFAPADPSRIETRHLTLTMSSSEETVAAGKAVSLYVDVAPKPKMHVYAPDQTDYIPIELRVEEGAGFRAQAIRYPPAEQFFFAPLNETQRVYSKLFRISQPVTIARNAATTAPLTIKGAVRYQACDDAICYLPQTIKVSWKLAVRGATTR